MTASDLRVASSRPVVVHPGFVKSATSTLQRRVFARHPDIAFLGIPAPTPELEWAIRHICHADGVHLERERLSEVLRKAVGEAAPGRIPLVSYENFALYESTDKELIAERVARLFPEARVMFTIRRQQDVVRSWYLTKLRHRLKRKAWIPFDEWYELAEEEPWHSILDDLAYGRTIGCYLRLFGRDRIGVFLYEELVRDPDLFAGDISAFLGVDAGRFRDLLEGARENVSMSQRYLSFWKRAAPLLPRKWVRKGAMRLSMRGGPTARIDLSPQTEADLRERVADDNAALAARFGLDLAGHGYLMPDTS